MLGTFRPGSVPLQSLKKVYRRFIAMHKYSNNDFIMNYELLARRDINGAQSVKP